MISFFASREQWKLPQSTRRPIPLMQLLPVGLMYGACFVALHHVAARWAMGGFYSLWFPAAGFRFAFLWRAGVRALPIAAIAELLLELATGETALGRHPLFSIAGIIGPCLVYGAAIYLVRSLAGRRTPMLRLEPLPFALAAVVGPVAACVAALPWALPSASVAGAIDVRTLVAALVVFVLGDMLGVLILAPPLIWLADRATGCSPWRVALPRLPILVEVAAVAGAAWGWVWVMNWAGLGLSLVPVLLATCWIGLRTGRPGAWAAIVLTAAILLPTTAQATDVDHRLALHMMLACIAAVGYLSGSFAEADANHIAEIARRDRLLYQAERLKTLRAMSVAVIHEISQPLSTIAIEANHLAIESMAPLPNLSELAATAQLIARKAQDMATMVRRLRGFGGSGADTPTPISIALLLTDLAAIAEPEANAARVALNFVSGSDAVVRGQDIELRQALLNLLRNAIAASPPLGNVEIDHFIVGQRAHIAVENNIDRMISRRPGMGLGLIIARSIAEAHGGAITEHKPSPTRIRFVLDLPIAGGSHE